MWLDSVVSSTDIATAEQEAVKEILPPIVLIRKDCFAPRSEAEHSKAVELFLTNPLYPTFSLPHPFYLDAAWLNEGRCPGGRSSVSKN